MDSMLLRLNLQLFAEGQGGDKTEEPTAKKREDTRKEGNVAKSREIANGLGLISLFLVLKFLVGWMGNRFLNVFSLIYEKIPDVVVFHEGQMPFIGTSIVFRYTITTILTILLPVLLVGYLVAFFSDFIQVEWKVTTKPLQPKLSKLNPISGFKKIFSPRSLVELLKSIAKIVLIIGISYSYLKDKLLVLFNFYDMSLMSSIGTIGNLVIDLGLRISLVYMIIAFADLAYQRWKFHKDIMMTKQEVKDEYKNSEGDPQIKGKIRQKMQEASRRRMMQSIPQADVVITNPTHFAVAIRYNPDESDAPVVTAKGADYLAQKIKEVAKENHIEIVENKPLARMLYHNVDIGQAVPPELYQAVAEVLAFVYHLQGKI